MAINTFIVEDNAVIRENLVETLHEMTPVEFMAYADNESAAAAWLKDADGSWQLAIVDLFLLQGSGLGVLKAVADREQYQKVVVLTNYATPDIRKRCEALGADAVFDKSGELDELVAFCRKLPVIE